MKKVLLSATLFIIVFFCYAQKDTLISFKKKSIDISKKSMVVLGSWAAANIITSSFSLNINSNDARYYHQMNIIWNSVNLALSGLICWAATKNKMGNLDLQAVLQHQQKTEKIFLLNTGIDVAYIAAGAFLKEKSKSKINPSKLKGHGSAVMLNGDFLFLFDVAMYAVHNKHGNKLNSFIKKLQLAGTGAGMSLVYPL
jgi:hypothetical protein